MLKLLSGILIWALTVICAFAQQQQMALPPHEDVGNVVGVRGYYFQAPTNFTITGIRAAKDFPKGALPQSIAIVRFHNGAPPNFPFVTNDFDQLFKAISLPSDSIIPVCIPVLTGEYIGIYGAHMEYHSYGTVTPHTYIMGHPVSIIRSGMNYNLDQYDMKEIWQEYAPIGRIEMYYDAPTPDTPADIWGDSSICESVIETYRTGQLSGRRFFWQATGGNIISGQGTEQIQIDWAGVPPGVYQVKVKTCIMSCMECSGEKSINVDVSATPQSGQISGSDNVCSGDNIIYTFSNQLENWLNYSWSVSPPGLGSVVLGQGSRVATVNFSGSGMATVKLFAQNECGTTLVGQKEVNIFNSIPQKPDPFSGDIYTCIGNIKNYSVPAQEGTSFTWSGFPNSVTILSGQGTNQISVDWRNTPEGFYSISVTPTNACGVGPSLLQTLIVLTTPPLMPTPIQGNPIICVGSGPYYYSINAAPNVIYEWSSTCNLPITVLSPIGDRIRIDLLNLPLDYQNCRLSVHAVNTCGSSEPSTLDLNIGIKPETPSQILGPLQVCTGSNTTYQVQPVPGATSYIWKIYPNNGYQFITPNGRDQVTLKWNVSGSYIISVFAQNRCGASQTILSQIRVSIPPSRPVLIVSPIFACPGEQRLRYAVQNQLGITYSWNVQSPLTYVPGGVNEIFVDVPQGTPPGNYVISVVANRQGCSSSPLNMSLRVNSGIPATPLQINSANEYCVGDTAQFTVDRILGATFYEWIFPNGFQIISGLNTSNVSVRLNLSGNFIIKVRAGNSCGTSEYISKQVHVGQKPNTPRFIRIDGDQCIGSTVQIIIENDSSGSLFQWRDNHNWSQTTNQATVNYPIGSPSNVVIVNIRNSCGVSNSLAIPVSGATIPNLHSVVGDTNLCSNSIGYYETDFLAGATYQWANLPPEAVVIGSRNENSLKVNWANVPAGNYTFYVTAQNSCGISNSLAIRVSLGTPPNLGMPISGKTIVCINSTEIYEYPQLIDGIQYRWSVVPSIVNLIPNSNRVTVSWTRTGNFILRLTPIDDCGSGDPIEINVSVMNYVSANAGTDQAVCNNSVTLLGTPPGGSWSCVICQGSPIIIPLNGGSVSITNLGMGESIFRYRIDSTGCGNPKDDVKITNYSINPGIIQNDQTICFPGNTLLTLSGFSPNSKILRWENSTDNFFNNVNPIVNTTNSLSITNLMTTTHYRAVLQSTFGNCPEVPTGPVKVTIVANQMATVSPAFRNICSETVTLTGNTPNSGIGHWEFLSGPAVPVIDTNGTTLTCTGITVAGDYKFRWVISNAPCRDVSAISIIKKINAPPTAYAGLDRVICEKFITLTGNNPQTGTPLWRLVSGANVNITQNGPVANVTGMVPGTYIFEYSISNQSCNYRTSDLMKVTVVSGTSFALIQGPTETCGNSVTLTGNQPDPGMPTWLCVNCPGNPIISVSQNGQVATVRNMNVVGDYLFKYSIASPPCAEAVDYHLVKKIGNLSAELLTPNVSVCADTTTLYAKPINLGSGTWTYISGPSANVNVQSLGTRGIIRGMLSDGVYTFRWTVSHPTCGSVFVDAIVNVSLPYNEFPFASSQTICETSTTALLLGSAPPSGVTSIWSFVSGPTNPNFTQFGNYVSIVNLSGIGDYVFQYAFKKGNCPLKTTLITVKRVASPTEVRLSAIPPVCGDSFSVTADTPTYGIGQWMMIPPPGASPNFSSIGQVATVSNINVSGNYIIRYTVSNPPCNPSTNQITVSVNLPTIGGNLTSSSYTVCRLMDSFTMNLTGYRGDIVRWESSTDNFVNNVNYINITQPQYSLPGINQTMFYRVVIKSGNCPEAVSNIIKIEVLPQPIAADAGADQEICGYSTTLTGNIASPFSPTWTFEGGPFLPDIQVINNQAFITNLNEEGNYTFRYIIDGGNCGLSNDIVKVKVSHPTVAGTLTFPKTFCTISNNHILQLSGYTGVILRWESSTDNWISIQSIANTDETLLISGLTQTTYYRVVVKNGSCASANSNSVRLVIIGNSPADAGLNQTICNSVTSLTGNTPSPGATGVWSFISGPGVMPVVIQNGITASVSQMTLAGVYKFEWKITHPRCGITRDTVSVTVLGGTIPGILNANATICSGGGTVLTLTGNIGNIIRWEKSLDNFITFTTISNTNTTLTINNLTQRTSFRAVVRNGVCDLAVTNQVNIDVTPQPIKPDLGPDRTVCGNSDLLKGTINSGGTPNWRLISGPNNISLQPQTAEVTASGLIPGNYSFEFSLSNVPCNSVSDTINISVLPPSNPGVLSSDASVCKNDNSGTITLSGNSGTILEWRVSENNFQTYQRIVNNRNTFSYTNLLKTTYIQVLSRQLPCDSVFSNIVKITVSNPPTAANAGRDTSICTNQITLTGNTPVVGVGEWSIVSQPNNAGAVMSGNEIVLISQLIVPGNYIFRYTITSPGCNPSLDEVLITVLNKSIPANLIPSKNVVCRTGNSFGIKATSFTGNIIHWVRSEDNWNTSSIIPFSGDSLIVNNLTISTQYKVGTFSGTCDISYSLPVTITVDNLSYGGLLSSAQTFCSQINSGVLQLNNYVGSIIRWESSVDGFINTVTINNTTSIQTFSNLSTTTSYRAVVKNGECTIEYSNISEIKIMPSVQGGNITSESLACIGNNIDLLLNNYEGDVIKWETSKNINFTPVIEEINTSNSSLTYTIHDSVTFFRVWVKRPGCDGKYSQVFQVLGGIGSYGGKIYTIDTILCTNGNTILELRNSVGTIQKWLSSVDSLTWNDIPNSVGQTSITINGILTTTFYKAIVKNANCQQAESKVLKIRVIEPTRGGTINSNTSVCYGQNSVNLHLEGHLGTILRWEMSVDCINFSNLQTIANTSTNLTVNNLFETTCYRAVLKNERCPEAYSTAAQITVSPRTLSGRIEGDTAVCIKNPNGTLRLLGNNANVVRWESSPNQITVTTIANVTTSQTFSNLSGTIYYRAIVKQGDCQAAITDWVKVTLKNPAIAGRINGSQTVCYGTNSVLLNLSGYQGDIYGWITRPNNSQSYTYFPNNSPNFLADSLTDTLVVRAIVHSGNCVPDTSAPVVIYVTPELELKVSTVTGCNYRGNATGIATGGDGNYTYSILPSVLPSNQTGIFPDLSPGNYTLFVSDGNHCSDQKIFTIQNTPSPPQILRISNITQSTALVFWTEIPPGAGVVYNLRYRVLGEPNWTQISNLTTTNRFLSGLQNNTNYEIQVQYVCPGNEYYSEFSNELIRMFTTLPTGTGNCENSPLGNVPVPGGIFIHQINSSSARLNWNAVAGAAGYIISYGLANDNPGTWLQAVICSPNTTYLMTNLRPNTQYRVRIRTNCSNCSTALDNQDKRSPWSGMFNFTTLSIIREYELIPKDTDLSIYPNPARDIVNIIFSTEEVLTSIKLIDALGREIFYDKITKSNGIYSLPLNSFPSGIYYIEIKRDKSAAIRVPLAIEK